MEGTMAEIRIFAGDFAPRTWSYCNGSLLAINTHQALFALLGTTYGGDGRQNFALPDLRGRTVIGVGQGFGLSSYVRGETLGTEMVTLVTPNLPPHSHEAVVNPGTGGGGGSAALYGMNSIGGEASPGGNYLGQDNSGAGVTNYAPAGTLVAMKSGSVTLSNVTVLPPTVTIANDGASLPHSNMMPSIALNYVICLSGVFPSRN